MFYVSNLFYFMIRFGSYLDCLFSVLSRNTFYRNKYEINKYKGRKIFVCVLPWWLAVGVVEWCFSMEYGMNKKYGFI